MRREKEFGPQGAAPPARAPRAVVALAAGALLCAGACIGWVAAWQGRPAILGSAPKTLEVPVTEQPFDDARTVSLSVSAGPAIDLTAAASGLLTSTTCAPGGTWTSGTTPLSIDGGPVLALATAMPLWRDLGPGDTGPDVDALLRALADLGATVPAGRGLDASTWSAVSAFLSSVGVPTSDDTVRRSALLWLPAASVTLAGCPAGVGVTTAPGTALGTAAPHLAGVRVDPVPADLTPGARTLTVGDVSVPVSDDGLVVDATALGQLAADPRITAAATGVGEQPAPSGRLALTTPLTVAVLPAGAVGGSGDAACVQTGDGPLRTTIVASTLGQTLAIFPGGAPPASVIVDPQRPATCPR